MVLRRRLALLLFVFVIAWFKIAAADDPAARWKQKMEEAGQKNSIEPLKEALQLAERFGETDVRLLETLIQFSSACDDLECGDKADSLAPRAYAIHGKVQPKDRHYADLLVRLAWELHHDRNADALRLFDEARAVQEREAGPESDAVAQVLASKAQFLGIIDNHEEGRKVMQQALLLRENAGAGRTAGYAELLDHSAQLFSAAGNHARAEEDWNRSIAIRATLWKPTDPRFIAALRQIADQDFSKAGGAYREALLRRVVELTKSVHTERSEEYYDAVTHLAAAISYQRHWPDAEVVYQQAFDVRKRMKKLDVKAIASLQEVARCRMAQNHYEAAVEAGKAALEIPGPHDRTLSLLAEAYLRARNVTESDKAFAVLSGSLSANNRPLIVHTAETLSNIYESRSDFPRAAAKLEQMLAVMEVGDSEDPRIPDGMMRLARLYTKMGRTEDANRMSLAGLQRTMASGTGQRGAQILGLLLLSALLFSVAIALVCQGLFRRFVRKLDRQLATLFEPQAPLSPSPAVEPSVNPAAPLDPIAEHQPVQDLAPEPTLVGVATPVPAPPAVSRIFVLADGSVLFAMRVLNLLLSLLTLGIYSFWGKAKVRNYVCAQSEFEGDRFAFHGTGKELLLGWLRALPALAFILLFPNVLPLVWQSPWSFYVAQLCALAAVIVLWPIALVGAHRYRLNRMSWRGVRFSFRGSALAYMSQSLAGTLLTIVTLGLMQPFQQIKLRSLLFNETYFGDRRFRFAARARDLMPCWVCAMPVIVVTLGLAWPWWSAIQERYFWAHTEFGNSRFRCTVTGFGLWRLWAGNFFLAVATLGIAMPWVTLRTLRFWTGHITLVGSAELETVRQDARATTAIGETFADYLGFDFGV